ncbi:MAG: NADH:ubiquinone oxidoreductase subunit NDUFA12, partial [Polymorphobacter sp.]
MGLLSNIFTWWNGPTYGTRFMTARTGTEVGRDSDGNVYFATRPGRKGTQRRWVIYAGTPEATRVPPEWHLWLHKTVDTTPDERPLKAMVWEKPWHPNETGTRAAHVPSGSLSVGGTRARATGDYEAWSP